MSTENPTPESDTPETDAASFVTPHGIMVTYQTTARTLERHRDAARAEAKEAALKLEGTQAAYDCACQTEATLRAEVERLTKERDEARAENSRLGAPIEAAIWSLVNELGRASWSREIIARHMRALVASVTNSQQKGGEQREALTAPQPATAKESTVRSRVIRRDNIAYLCIYLRNAGERLRAIMLAADVFNLNVKQAKEWVDSVTYIREKVDNSKAREAFAKYPTDLIAEVSLEDSYEIRVSHYPLAAGAPSAAPATQELTSNPEGAANLAQQIALALYQHAEELRRHKRAIKVAKDALKECEQALDGSDRAGYAYTATAALAAIDKELKP